MSEKITPVALKDLPVDDLVRGVIKSPDAFSANPYVTALVERAKEVKKAAQGNAKK